MALCVSILTLFSRIVSLTMHISVYEMQIFLSELISNFEFSLAVPVEKILREPSSVMVTTILGENEKGSQLPVNIKVASRSGL